MRLAPLPIPTRVYRGENIDSYSRRHAARDGADPWRATNRVWTVIRHLTERRRDALYYRVPIRDTYYNILRLI